MELVNLEYDFPDVHQVVMNYGLPSVGTVGYRAGDYQYSEISDSYVAPNFSMKLESSASRDGGLYVISHSLAANSANGEALQIRAPFLTASLALAEDPDQYGDRADDYVQAVLTSANKTFALEQSGFKYFVDTPYELSEKQTLFIVTHPVTVSNGGWSECVMMTAYSHFPISFGFEQCAS